MFEKGKIQEYSTWAEFEREAWHTINNKTEAISLVWDISIKLPKYENPQRHTLKVRIGRSVSPKDMMELVFNSDDPTELREKSADGVVKVDFIDQVIAGELIEKVTNWYDGLSKVEDDLGIQNIMEKYQSLIVGIVHNFVPILFLSIYHYYFLAFCTWGNALDNINLANIQMLLISFIAIFLTGTMFAKRFSRWIGNKIDQYKGISQFEITRGDENAASELKQNNNSVTKQIVLKVSIASIASVAAFFVRHALESWLG